MSRVHLSKRSSVLLLALGGAALLWLASVSVAAAHDDGDSTALAAARADVPATVEAPAASADVIAPTTDATPVPALTGPEADPDASAPPAAADPATMSAGDALAAPPLALPADGIADMISNVRIDWAAIDRETGLPSVSISVDCIASTDFVRVRVTLSQRHGQAEASSSQTFGGQCIAGQVLTVVVVFGPQQGEFRPGPATLVGFVAATPNGGGADDLETIASQRVKLKPS